MHGSDVDHMVGQEDVDGRTPNDDCSRRIALVP